MVTIHDVKATPNYNGALGTAVYQADMRLMNEDADWTAAEVCVEVRFRDRETLTASVAKTGRAVIIHEAPLSFGPGAEIAASIMEGAFLSLEAPIRRVTAHDVPFVGFARERANLPDVTRVVDACRETLSF